MSDQPEKPGRRKFLAAILGSAAGAGPFTATAQSTPKPITPYDALPQITRTIIENRIHEAVQGILSDVQGGKSINDLHDTQLALLRSDISGTLPEITDQKLKKSIEEITSFPIVQNTHVFIAVSPKGVVTGFRRLSGQEDWEEAGFSAPEGVNIREDIAFRDSAKPTDWEKPDRFIKDPHKAGSGFQRT